MYYLICGVLFASLSVACLGRVVGNKHRHSDNFVEVATMFLSALFALASLAMAYVRLVMGLE